MNARSLSPRVGVNHPPLGSAEVKERKELYHSGPSWSWSRMKLTFFYLKLQTAMYSATLILSK
jgi:hypothetical protein